MKLPQLPERLRGKHLGLAFGIAAVIAFYVVIGKVVPHDNLQKLLEDVSNTLGAWTYLLVGGFAFLETGAGVGLVVPGETAMLLGGAVAGQGAITAARRSCSAVSSAWSGRWRRSSPAARGCATGPLSPTACSAAASGRRPTS